MTCAGVQQAQTMPWTGRHTGLHGGLHGLDYRGGVRLLAAIAPCEAGNATSSTGFTSKKE